MKSIFYCLLWLSLFNSCLQTRELPRDTTKLMQHYQDDGADFLGSPLSGAFLVAKDDSLIYKQAITGPGLTGGTNISFDSKFYIGSVSKQFTACLILLLAQDDNLDLNVPISRYLPTLPPAMGDHITIYHLLSHTSGLPHYPELLKHGYTAERFFQQKLTVAEYVALIGKLRLQSPPGAVCTYSSFGYVLLGAIIEAVTQKTYAEILAERITNPLGLKNTGYSDDLQTNGVVNDLRYNEGTLIKSSTFSDASKRELSTAYATGGIYSSLNDLYLWSKAIRNHRLLEAKYQDLMFSPVKNGVCYGWYHNPEQFLRKDQNVQLYYHGGGIMNYRSALAMYEDGVTIICLFHTLPLNNSTAFIHQLHLSALGQNRPVKHFIHPSLRNLPHFREEGGLNGLAQYHQKLSERAGHQIYPSPGTMSRVIEMHLEEPKAVEEIKKYVRKRMEALPEMPESLINSMGYAFLQHKHFEFAIRLFQENINRYPHSSNVFDSLGEAYEKAGQLDAAKVNYAKALQIAIEQNDANKVLYQKNLERVTQ